MDRERQIELMKSAEERTNGYVRAWVKNPQFKAALHRDHRKQEEEPRPQKPETRRACG